MAQTSGVTLRPTRHADLDWVLEAEGAPAQRPWVSQWPRARHEDAIGRADRIHAIVEWAGRRAGYAILALDGENRTVELVRIVVVEPGRGIGRAALRLIQRHAFVALRAHRLWLDVFTDNQRAHGLYASEGFVQEGVLRDCVWKDGQPRSLIVLSIARARVRTTERRSGRMTVEPWLRGSVTGVPAALQPAAHALLNALGDVESLETEGITDAELRARPGGAPPIAFHLLHLAGAVDRLITYAEGGLLDDAQKLALRRETDADVQNGLTVVEAVATVRNAVEGALGVLRGTDPALLPAPREVGRARLPSTVGGLLFHAAEHAARHAGQALTTFRIVRGLAARS